MAKKKIKTSWYRAAVRPFSRMLRAVVRCRLFEGITIAGTGWFVRPINSNVSAEVKVLVLDRERWWSEDLQMLGSRAALWDFSSQLRGWLTSLYMTAEDNERLIGYDFSGISAQHKQEQVCFLARFLEFLRRKRGIDCIVTTNHMYLQNKLVAEAAASIGMPFVDMHKECMKDELVAKEFANKYKALGMNMRFLGERICVYNEFMKKFFCGLNVCPPERISVTGALRIDHFSQRVRQFSGKERTLDTVTLFSFRHLPFGGDPSQYVQHFSPDASRGYVRLFDDVHGVFARLAHENPDVSFVVKLKWKGDWVSYIMKAFRKAGFPLESIPNMRIVATEEDAQDLIVRSIAAIGLNSTTLLETRLAGRPSILPYFGELIDTYPDTVVFRDAFSEFNVVRSAEGLRQAVEAMIRLPPEDRPMSDAVIQRYFGYNDGKSLERVIAELKRPVSAAIAEKL